MVDWFVTRRAGLIERRLTHERIDTRGMEPVPTEDAHQIALWRRRLTRRWDDAALTECARLDGHPIRPLVCNEPDDFGGALLRLLCARGRGDSLSLCPRLLLLQTNARDISIGSYRMNLK